MIGITIPSVDCCTHHSHVHPWSRWFHGYVWYPWVRSASESFPEFRLLLVLLKRFRHGGGLQSRMFLSRSLAPKQQHSSSIEHTCIISSWVAWNTRVSVLDLLVFAPGLQSARSSKRHRTAWIRRSSGTALPSHGAVLVHAGRRRVRQQPSGLHAARPPQVREALQRTLTAIHHNLHAVADTYGSAVSPRTSFQTEPAWVRLCGTRDVVNIPEIG